jgi:hypothetical protein
MSVAAERAREPLREKFEQLRVQVREEFEELRAGIKKLEAKEGG